MSHCVSKPVKTFFGAGLKRLFTEDDFYLNFDGFFFFFEKRLGIRPFDVFKALVFPLFQQLSNFLLVGQTIFSALDLNL